MSLKRIVSITPDRTPPYYGAFSLEPVRILQPDELAMLAAGLAGAGQARFVLQEPWDSIEIEEEQPYANEDSAWMGFL
jgi:hypothetical protein